MDVTIEDHTVEVKKELEVSIKAILEALGTTAEGYAKEGCPVDTGRLRNSITNQIIEDEKAVAIGTNVEYAKVVELSDSAKHKVGGAHFLANAVRNHTDHYSKIVEAGLKD